MNGTRPNSIHAQPMHLAHVDQPGTCAYETPAQAERKRFEGAATVRTLQPGSTFTLLNHPEHDGGLPQGSEDEARFVVLGMKTPCPPFLRGNVLAEWRRQDCDSP